MSLELSFQCPYCERWHQIDNIEWLGKDKEQTEGFIICKCEHIIYLWDIAEDSQSAQGCGLKNGVMTDVEPFPMHYCDSCETCVEDDEYDTEAGICCECIEESRELKAMHRDFERSIARSCRWI